MEEPKQMEEPTKKEQPIKFNFLEYTTIIYAFLTFLGYSYIDWYYLCWGIHINSYLDLGEVLLLFLSNINYLLILLIFSFSVLFIIAIILPPFKLLAKIEQQVFPLSANNKIYSRNITIFHFLIYLVFIGIMYLFYLIGFDKYNIILTSILMSIAVLSSFILTFLPRLLYKFRVKIKLRYILYSVIIVFIFLCNITFASYKYFSIKNKNIETNITFTFDTITHKTNDSIQYIGATSKYIFLKNTNSRTFLIFDKSSIKNLSISGKRISTK